MDHLRQFTLYPCLGPGTVIPVTPRCVRCHFISCLVKEEGPGVLKLRAVLELRATAIYAAICFTNGAVVLISIFRGSAATAIVAVISSTPLMYSAVSFS